MHRLALLLTFYFGIGAFALADVPDARSETPQPNFHKDYTYHSEVDGWLKLHRSPATWFQARLRCHSEGMMLQFQTPDADFRKDYTYYEKVYGWLKLHRSPATWSQARLRCHAEGSILASPLNEDFQTTMTSVIGQKAPSIFTGISTNIVKDEYLSVEGISLDKIPTAWVNKEPGQEQCIAMHKDGTLEDVSCSKPRPYMCYKKKSQNMSQINKCGTPDSQYEYKEDTASCYKFHKIGQRWADAYKTCLIEGGYLVIVNSKEEAEILKKIADKYPGDAITARDKYMIATGFHDWSDHKLWMTIYGETLEGVGFPGWDGNQPGNNTNISKDGEYCGAIYNGLLHDIGCDYTVPFICEMDAVYDIDDDD